MPQKTDLYTIMSSYARKAGSPTIEMEAFIQFLDKYSKRVCEEKPEWNRWAAETGTKVWMETNHLVEEGKLVLRQSVNDGAKVDLSCYYADMVGEAYKNADEDADLPFPTEESLKIIIPKEQVKPTHVLDEMRLLFEKPQQELLPIIKLLFPSDGGSALVLGPMISSTLMEFSILKMRTYLLRHGNREYVQRKLTPQLPGKEPQLREILDQLAIRPNDCLNDLKRHREVSFYFWGHFCNLVRTELANKNDPLPGDVAALQASYIMDVFNNHMKNRATKAKEQEQALKNFETEMDKAPYYFSRESIMRFKDSKGVPLLDVCGQEALDAYIRKRTTESASPNVLPDYVYFRMGDGVSWLVKKTRVLTLCARLLAETRALVISAIHNRWKIMLKEFRKERAMDDDDEFEELIGGYVKEHTPLLRAVLYDEKLPLIYEEMMSSKKDAGPSSRLFDKNKLLPLRVLLNLKRKQILTDVRFLLPFWNTLFFNLIAAFKNFGKKKKKRRSGTEEIKEKQGNDPLNNLQVKAQEAKAKLIPEGHTLDSYLKDVSLRWVELLNKQAYEDLIEDVNRLIRDRLRHLLRLKGRNIASKDALDTMAYTILDSSQGLRKIRDQSSLLLYIKLYMIKILTSKVEL